MGTNKKISMEDVRQFSADDLKTRIQQENEKLTRSTFSHKVTGLDNPASIRAIRRDIARLNTELSSRKQKA
jgi:large subunit ribosomal protein L29